MSKNYKKLKIYQIKGMKYSNKEKVKMESLINNNKLNLDTLIN